MKRSFFFFFLLLACSSVNAQEEPDCNCEWTTAKGIATKVLCSYTGIDQDGNPIYNPDALTITIDYTTVICGDVSRVRVNSILISNSLYNYHNMGYDPDPETMGCPYYPLPDPSDTDAIQAWLAALLYEMLPQYNTNQVLAFFPAGCASLVLAEWPDGTKLVVFDDGGSREIDLSGAHTLHLVPCNQATCCVVEITDEGEIIYRPIIPAACEEAEPDPGFIPTLCYYTPDGVLVTQEGTIIEATPCIPLCPATFPRAEFITTDMSEDTSQTVLSANPTLVHDKIWFTSNTPIVQVEVYDTQGKMIMQTKPENNEMSTHTLQLGAYLLRVRFSNQQVKSVKICKQ